MDSHQGVDFSSKGCINVTCNQGRFGDMQHRSISATGIARCLANQRCTDLQINPHILPGSQPLLKLVHPCCETVDPGDDLKLMPTDAIQGKLAFPTIIDQ